MMKQRVKLRDKVVWDAIEVILVLKSVPREVAREVAMMTVRMLY
jgi:hypothetical protein